MFFATVFLFFFLHFRHQGCAPSRAKIKHNINITSLLIQQRVDFTPTMRSHAINSRFLLIASVSLTSSLLPSRFLPPFRRDIKHHPPFIPSSRLMETSRFYFFRALCFGPPGVREVWVFSVLPYSRENLGVILKFLIRTKNSAKPGKDFRWGMGRGVFAKRCSDYKDKAPEYSGA